MEERLRAMTGTVVSVRNKQFWVRGVLQFGVHDTFCYIGVKNAWDTTMATVSFEPDDVESVDHNTIVLGGN